MICSWIIKTDEAIEYLEIIIKVLKQIQPTM